MTQLKNFSIKENTVIGNKEGISIRMIHDLDEKKRNEILCFNRNIIELLIGCSMINNNPKITARDIINIRAFAKIYDLELIFSNNKENLQLKKVTIKSGVKHTETWFIEKTMQFKPFVKSTIYYRYRIKNNHKTRLNGEVKIIETNDFVDILIPRGTQLAFDNKAQKYYYKHKKYGNMYMSTDVLNKNESIGIYAITAKNIQGKCINISHFIFDLLQYESEMARREVLRGSEIFYGTEHKIYCYFKRIIDKIHI